MRRRCLNPKDNSYANYGERGIVVCESWLNSFEAFFADMGRRPGKGYSIERKDNNGPYCKENCVWATRKEQSSNTRQNRFVIVDGAPMTAKAAAAKLGIPYTTVLHRLDRGYSPESALR